MNLNEDYRDELQKKVHLEFSPQNWLSSEHNCYQLMLWTTFYRKNIHRFAMDYLGLSLYWYQIIILYLMGRSNFVVWIAARASAKSYIIAVYSCCIAILKPNSMIVLTSGTKGQSRLIVSKKINGELVNASPNLRREIVSVKDNANEVLVTFANHSTIATVTCSDNARGNRSTVNVGEEAREINKDIMDKVISPFQIVRQAPFRAMAPYAGDTCFEEEPTQIYISSSFEDSHWLYKSAVLARDGMMKDEGSFFVALDYAVTLKHGIRTKKWLSKERKRTDDLTWAVEYDNAVLRSNSKAYFTYDIMHNTQTIKVPFYPRRNEDVIAHKSNRYDIPKQSGEIRLVSCDIAAIDRSANDNSVFSCLRLFPESISRGDGTMEREYRVQIPYLEAMRGSEVKKQAIRIRQLFEDFHADYIVLDIRNIGIGVYDSLARVLYDDERNCEYPPVRCMNDEALARRINNPLAKECLYAITASQRLNSDIAVNMRNMLTDRLVDTLISRDDGVEEITRYIPEYAKSVDPDVKFFYERPYFENMMLVSETIRLQYERAENTGIIKIRERGAENKDRYTSVSYGLYFASMLARDLLSDDGESFDFNDAPSCVSSFEF